MDSPAEPTTGLANAASALLLRDGSAGPEVLLLRRSSKLSSWADNWVFPGGREDAHDDSPFAQRCLSNRAMELDATTRRALSTVVRETFEECGALLAISSTTGNDPTVADSLRQCPPSQFFPTLCSLGFVIDPHAIVPWSRWIPPITVARRYDTRFFIALCTDPAGLKADGHETDALRWLPIADAATQSSSSALLCAPPTIINLLELQQCAAGCADASEIVSRARSRSFITIEPQVRSIAGKHWALYPWDPEFSVAEMQTTAIPDRYRELPSRLLLSTG